MRQIAKNLHGHLFEQISSLNGRVSHENPNKTLIFILPIFLPFANIVLCAICRTLRRPQISCPGNAKIMCRGAGRASFFIDNYLGTVFGVMFLSIKHVGLVF